MPPTFLTSGWFSLNPGGNSGSLSTCSSLQQTARHRWPWWYKLPADITMATLVTCSCEGGTTCYHDNTVNKCFHGDIVQTQEWSGDTSNVQNGKDIYVCSSCVRTNHPREPTTPTFHPSVSLVRLMLLNRPVQERWKLCSHITQIMRVFTF